MRKQFMLQTDWIITTAGAANDATLGAWVRVHAYCAPRLNGGRLVGAKSWNQNTTLRVCGVARRSLDAMVAAGIAEWSGEDLVLRGYDLAGEQSWQAKSDGGKIGRQKQVNAKLYAGSAPSGILVGTPRGKPEIEPSGVPVGESESEGEGEGEGERVSEDKSATPSPPAVLERSSTPAVRSAISAPAVGQVGQEREPANVEEHHLMSRVKGVDEESVRKATIANDLLGVLAAFGCAVSGSYPDEWRRDCDGLQLGIVVVILAWRRRHKDSVRLPSGWRKARKAWGELCEATRRQLVAKLLAEFGITVPKRNEASTATPAANNGGKP